MVYRKSHVAICGVNCRSVHMADSDAYPGAPRWVRVFAIAALVVAGLFVALHLTGHGPGEHFHSHHTEHPMHEGAQP
jgi:hypothetical protein